jgi:hypothetical protein
VYARPDTSAKLVDEVKHLESEVDASLTVLLGSHGCVSRLADLRVQRSLPGAQMVPILYAIYRCHFDVKCWGRLGRQVAPCDV